MKVDNSVHNMSGGSDKLKNKDIYISVNSPQLSCNILLTFITYVQYSTVDVSVLLENNQWRIFHILTSEDISMTSFTAFCIESIYIINRKLHGGLKIWFLVVKTIFYSFATLIRKILFSPLEDKIHIFAPLCNILYILQTCIIN